MYFTRHEYKSYPMRHVSRNPVFLITLSKYFFSLRLQYNQILKASETNPIIMQISVSNIQPLENKTILLHFHSG